MAQVMRDPKLDMRLRLDAAKALLVAQRQGKRERAADAAWDAATGRFRATQAPKSATVHRFPQRQVPPGDLPMG